MAGSALAWRAGPVARLQEAVALALLMLSMLCVLQDWVGGGQVPVSPRPSGRLLSGQLSSHLSTHQSTHLPTVQLQTAASKPDSVEEGGLEPRVPWYRQRSLQLVLAGYASIAFLMNFLEELTPIYASAPYRLVSICALSQHHSCCPEGVHTPASVLLICELAGCCCSPERTPEKLVHC